jgi:dihydroorotate dehydrogenase electron transfer subunit
MITKIQKGWKELKAEIVDTDKCCLCGACVNFCDNLAMTPAGPVEQGMLCEEQSTCREGFGTCYNLCPYTGTGEMPLSLLDGWVHDVASKDPDNQFHHEITVVAARYSGSQKLVSKQQGGATASLLIAAMRSGIIDGVLTSHLNADVPRVVTTDEDILAIAHATAFANAPLSGISQAISAGHESLAVIGSGCEIQGLRKMQNHPAVDLEVHDLVTLAIGAFCFFKSKPSKLESFLGQKDVTRAAIERIDHDGGAFKCTFTAGSETIVVPVNELYEKTAKGSCASCEDGTANLADISIGTVDALQGWDVLIVHTAIGMKLLKAAIEMGLLETKDINAIIKNNVLDITRNKIHFAAIESIEVASVDTKRFTFTAPGIARNYKPGQFVVLWLPDVDFLPMSIERVAGDKISILVQQIGEGTTALLARDVGDKIGIRGPYGNGWDLSKDNYLVVGGGVGIAEVTNAIDYLTNNQKKVTAIFGGQSKDHLSCAGLFDDMNLQACIMTDDGSEGQQGFATDPIETMIKENSIESIITCGPEIMMRKVFDIANGLGIPVQASLERMMKCCVGLCGTCCVGEQNDITVCKMGPVFDQDTLAKLPQFGSYKKG